MSSIGIVMGIELTWLVSSYSGGCRRMGGVRLVRVGGRDAGRSLPLRRQPPLALEGHLGRRQRGLERRLRRAGRRQLRSNMSRGQRQS